MKHLFLCKKDLTNDKPEVIRVLNYIKFLKLKSGREMCEGLLEHNPLHLPRWPEFTAGVLNWKEHPALRRLNYVFISQFLDSNVFLAVCDMSAKLAAAS